MKIGITGAGAVDSTAAFALVVRGLGSEIVLVDPNADLARAQGRGHPARGAVTAPVRVRAGDYPALDGAGVVIVSAGAAQKPGGTRLQLLERNASMVTPEFEGVRGFSLSVPRIVAAGGVSRTFMPKLSNEEREALARSARIVAAAAAGAK